LKVSADYKVDGACFVITKLDVFNMPTLVNVAGVLPAAQLGQVVAVRAFYIQYLVDVISVHNLVAFDTPEMLAIAHLELPRVHTITCNITPY